ncbi:hypothetical protein J4E81_007581 [Alternaria sp. BMP 2799]|nr:hypothetical protein J4E81_007581 [Alternaria sp. BMP 2799]
MARRTKPKSKPKAPPVHTANSTPVQQDDVQAAYQTLVDIRSKLEAPKKRTAKQQTKILRDELWNLQFAREIETRLPTELRAMIFDYIWDNKAFKYYEESMQYRLNPESCRSDVPELPHFIQSRFMGLKIAHEVMVKWYEVQPDRSDSGSYPDIDGFGPVEYITIASTERVVCQDIWDVGLIPADVLQSLYVCLWESNTDIDAEGETLVKTLMSIRKKRNFSLHIELVQQEVRLNLYDDIEFDLTEVLRDTSGSEQWRQDAREYLDSLDDYILKEYHEDPWIAFSERHYLIENEPDYDPKNYAHPALNTPPGFYPESSEYSDSEDDSEDDASQDDAGEDDPSEEDSSADDASEDDVNADDAGEHDSIAAVSTTD